MAQATMDGRRRSKNRKKRIGLSRLQEQRKKEQLREVAPSEPWVEAQIRGYDDTDPDGNAIVYRFFDSAAFPPKADTTPMAACPLCGRLVPPNSIEIPLATLHESMGGRCMDCRPAHIHEAHGASPSATAIQMLQHMNLRLDEVKLEPESFGALMEEIRQVKSVYRAEGPSPFMANFTRETQR